MLQLQHQSPQNIFGVQLAQEPAAEPSWPEPSWPEPPQPDQWFQQQQAQMQARSAQDKAEFKKTAWILGGIFGVLAIGGTALTVWLLLKAGRGTERIATKWIERDKPAR